MKKSGKQPEYIPLEDAVIYKEEPAEYAYLCSLNGRSELFLDAFENAENPYNEFIEEAIQTRQPNGKTPIDIASILGRKEIVKFILERTADTEESVESKFGYTPLHNAATWGQLTILKILYEKDADLTAKTRNGEKAVDIAKRYNHTECVEYLEWAEARNQLLEAISSYRETLTDPEKIIGKLNREDKLTSTAVFKEKEEWMNYNPEPSKEDYIKQREDLESRLDPIIQKLSEPAPSTTPSVSSKAEKK